MTPQSPPSPPPPLEALQVNESNTTVESNVLTFQMVRVDRPTPPPPLASCASSRDGARAPTQTHTGAVEPYQAQAEAQQRFETKLKSLLECYAPTCHIRLTLHPSSAKIPVTGLACNTKRPGADGVLRWWCTWMQQ